MHYLAAGGVRGEFRAVVGPADDQRVRQGARANAYLQQKFPGITLAEVREMLTALQTISGRYGGVRAEGMAARDCFRITSAPA